MKGTKVKNLMTRGSASVLRRRMTIALGRKPRNARRTMMTAMRAQEEDPHRKVDFFVCEIQCYLLHEIRKAQARYFAQEPSLSAGIAKLAGFARLAKCSS